NFAKEHHVKVKLVPLAQKLNDQEIALYVLPSLIPASNFLYNVENEYNAVSVKAAFADQQLFYGKGAGGHPTGSAVLSDITALRYDYRYEYHKYKQSLGLSINNEALINVYIRLHADFDGSSLPFIKIFSRNFSGSDSHIIGSIRISDLIENKTALE